MTGRVVRTQATTIERVEVPARTRLRGHGHDAPHLCFLAAGAFDERHNGGWRSVGTGTMRSSPAGDQHDLAFRAPSRCLLVLISGDPGGVAPRYFTERRFHLTPRIQTIAAEVERSLRQPLAVSPLMLEARVLELLAAALPRCRRAMKPPPWLARVRERIHDEPADPPSAAQLATETGYHPVYVARAFRACYGIGLGEYARLVRAEHARELLATSAAPLAQVALRAGYADQSHLTRSVRRFLGATPGQVRRRRGRLVKVASIQDAGRADR